MKRDVSWMKVLNISGGREVKELCLREWQVGWIKGGFQRIWKRMQIEEISKHNIRKVINAVVWEISCEEYESEWMNQGCVEMKQTE